MFYTKLDLHGKLDSLGKLTKRGKQVVLYEVYDGFGVAIDVLRHIRSVEVHYKGQVYTAKVQNFIDDGVPHDFGGEHQLILPRKFWRIGNQSKLW